MEKSTAEEVLLFPVSPASGAQRHSKRVWRGLGPRAPLPPGARAAGTRAGTGRRETRSGGCSAPPRLPARPAADTHPSFLLAL